ncbi:MAG: SRPBCC family protein [Polyangiaceae bacterium]
MPLIRIETFIGATPETCFDLARSVEAHVGSTAKTGERVVGGKTTGLLELGDEVTWEATHFGIKQRLTSKMTKFDRPHMFEDCMVRGAFRSFSHVHEFSEERGGTRMVDLFQFESPLGILGSIANALFLTRYMHAFLEERAAYLKAEAERLR